MLQKRITLAGLLKCGAEDCQQALHARCARQLQQLSTVPLPLKLQPVRENMVTAAIKAEALAAAPSTVGGALEEVERFTNNAAISLKELREPSGGAATSRTIQSLLDWSFSELLAYRVLAQRHAELDRDPSAGSGMIEPDCPLDAVLKHSIEDARAFCREKFGDSPEVELVAVGEGPSTLALALPAYLRFPLHELLKNAMGAHARRAGADRLDELPHIRVSYAVTRDGWGGIEVEDCGGGCSAPGAASESARFLSTTNPEREPNYQYSRDFGSQFEGLGMGLPLARLHARYLGGELQLAGLPGVGVRATLGFDATGTRSDAMCDAAWVQRWVRE